MDITSILIWIAIGLILGVIAKVIMGEAMGWLGTIVCGILGAVLGGYLGGLLGHQGNAVANYNNIWSWAFSVLGTVIVIAIFRVVRKAK